MTWSRAQVGDWAGGAGGAPNVNHDPNRQSQGHEMGRGHSWWQGWRGDEREQGKGGG